MRRSLAALAILLAILAVSGAWSVPAPVSSPGPDLHLASTPTSILQSSVATKTGTATRTFYQNSSATYGTGSSQLLIPFNLGGYVSTSISLTTLTITVSMPNGMTPMINVTQGASTFLFNGTVTNQFSISPTVSATNVKVKVPAAFTSAGGTPASVATYPVYYNWTARVVYVISSLPSWILVNGSFENLSYHVVDPTGYTLNATSITVPYPVGAQPNVTTLNVTTRVGYVYAPPFTNLTTYTTTPDAGFLTAYVPYVPSNETLRVKYIVVGLQTGTIPLLVMGPTTLLANGLYTATASWVNTRGLPYGGTYFVQTNGSTKYAIVASSLNVTANTKFLHNNTFSLAGAQIIILAGAWTTYGGRVVVFTFRFALTGVAPAYSLCIACPVGGSGVAWWQVIVVAEVLLLVFVAVSYRSVRNRRIVFGTASGTNIYVGLAAFFFVAALTALAALSGGGH